MNRWSGIALWGFGITAISFINFSVIGINPINVKGWWDLVGLIFREPSLIALIFTRNPYGNPVLSSLLFGVGISMLFISIPIMMITWIMDMMAYLKNRSSIRNSSKSRSTDKATKFEARKKPTITKGSSISLEEDNMDYIIDEDDYKSEISEKPKRNPIKMSIPSFSFMKKKKTQDLSSLFGGFSAIASSLKDIGAGLEEKINSIKKSRGKATLTPMKTLEEQERIARAEKINGFWEWADRVKKAETIEDKISLAAQAAALSKILTSNDRKEIADLRPLSGEVNLRMLDAWSNKAPEAIKESSSASSREKEVAEFKRKIEEKKRSMASAPLDIDSKQNNEMMRSAALAILKKDDREEQEYTRPEKTESVMIESVLSESFSDAEGSDENERAVEVSYDDSFDEIQDDIFMETERLMREEKDEMERNFHEEPVNNSGSSISDQWDFSVEESYSDDTDDINDHEKNNTTDINMSINKDEFDSEIEEAEPDDDNDSNFTSAMQTKKTGSWDLEDLWIEASKRLRYARIAGVYSTETDEGLWDSEKIAEIYPSMERLSKTEDAEIISIVRSGDYDDSLEEEIMELRSALIADFESVMVVLESGTSENIADEDGEESNNETNDDEEFDSAAKKNPSGALMDSPEVYWDSLEKEDRPQTKDQETFIEEISEDDHKEEIKDDLEKETNEDFINTILKQDNEENDHNTPTEKETDGLGFLGDDSSDMIVVKKESIIDWRKEYGKADVLCDGMEEFLESCGVKTISQMKRITVEGMSRFYAHVFFKTDSGSLVVMNWININGDNLSIKEGNGIEFHCGDDRVFATGPVPSKDNNENSIVIFLIVHGSASKDLGEIMRIKNVRIMSEPVNFNLLKDVLGL